MLPLSQTLFNLFGVPIQYVIPIFQRRYVWTRKRQWEKLWADVQRTTELRMANPSSNREHFLGAIIVRAENPAPGGIAKWSVIDGQQRLTTFQLLLDASELALSESGSSAANAAAQIHTLIENPKAFQNPTDSTSWLKLKPGGSDLPSFATAMSNKGQWNLSMDGDLIGQAHEYFRGAVSDWLNEQEEQKATRANALADTLLNGLRLVTITIGPNDHPNWIFETLNARGTPLQAWDLVKNYLLFEEREQGGNETALYQNFLEPVEQNSWWSARVQQGSQDIDNFIFYWLITRTTRQVRFADTYTEFQAYARPLTPVAVAADLAGSADLYRRMMLGGVSSTIDERLRRWRGLDIGVSTPLILWLLENTGGTELERSLQAIESFFVRRMVCGFGVMGLNNWFPQILAKLGHRKRATAFDVLIGELGNSPRSNRIWPADSDFAEALKTKPVYRELSPRTRLRTILEALEVSLGQGKVPMTPKGGLTIEHIMPQNWRKNWPLRQRTEEARTAAADDRDLVLHTIGNLTLSTTSLGAQMGDEAWNKKRHNLKRFGLMMLTNQALDLGKGGWTESKIRERSLWLANEAIEIWPPPDKI